MIMICCFYWMCVFVELMLFLLDVYLLLHNVNCYCDEKLKYC
jgi:hypothetical protein